MKRVDYWMFGYAIAGALVNVISIWRLKHGEIPLSPRDPTLGIGLMVLVACVVWIGIASYRRVSAALLVPLTALIAWGTISHVLAPFRPLWHSMYASPLSWFVVTSLNGIGVMAFFVAIVTTIGRRTAKA